MGKKLADPLSDIWALFTEFNHTWSDGDATNGHEEGTHIIFQPIMPFKLMANYKDFKDSPNISGVNLPDFNPLVDITSPADGLEVGIKMPQQVHAAIHHQWNDKLALLGSGSLKLVDGDFGFSAGTSKKPIPDSSKTDFTSRASRRMAISTW